MRERLLHYKRQTERVFEVLKALDAITESDMTELSTDDSMIDVDGLVKELENMDFD